MNKSKLSVLSFLISISLGAGYAHGQVGAVADALEGTILFSCAMKFEGMEKAVGLKAPIPIKSDERYDWIGFRAKYQSCLDSIVVRRKTCEGIVKSKDDVFGAIEQSYEKASASGENVTVLENEIESLLEGTKSCFEKSSSKDAGDEDAYVLLQEFVRPKK